MRGRVVLSVLALLGAALVGLYFWYVRGAGIGPQIVAGPGLRWEVKKPLPQARTEVTVAVWRGRVVVVGGFDGFARTTATVQIYDPVRDAWELGPPLPHSVHHAMAAAVGDRLYLVGGLSGVRFHPTARVFVFDGGWREVAPLPEPLGASGIGVLDGRIHVISGEGPGGNVATHYVYDPSADRWERRPEVPAPRDHLAAVVLNGRLYAIGGRLEGSLSRNLTRVDVYDPRTDTWVTAPPIQTARSGHTAAMAGRRIFVFGGEQSGGTIAPVEAFDGTRWTTVSRMPTPRHGLGAAVLGQTMYLLAGGKRPGLSVSGTNEALTVSPSAP